jgi:hypothetical protein
VSWKTPRIETDSGLFAVRAASRSTEVGQAVRKSRVRASSVEVRLDAGVGPSIVLRHQCPGIPPSILLLPRAFMLVARGSTHDRLSSRKLPFETNDILFKKRLLAHKCKRQLALGDGAYG